MDLERHAAREEAALWLSKVERGLHGEEGTQLRKWLKTSAHRAAILDLARHWHGPEVLALLAEIFPITLQVTVTRPRRRLSVAAIAAGGAVCIAILALWLLDHQRVWADFLAERAAAHGAGAPPKLAFTKLTYITGARQHQEITLPDGSHIALNSNSNVVVDYSTQERHVWLERGEASFHVAEEAERPFVVRAGWRHRFAATGTEFDVHVIAPDNVELIVAAGQVKVFAVPDDEPETPALARLHANALREDMFVDAMAWVQVESGLQFTRKLSVAEMDRLLAWRHGGHWHN
jgi:transmembrane sensor